MLGWDWTGVRPKRSGGLSPPLRRYRIAVTIIERASERTSEAPRAKQEAVRANAQVQSFLSEEAAAEEAAEEAGGENGAIGIMGILTAATKPGIFTPLKRL